MNRPVMPLARQAATRGPCSAAGRLAIVVGIAVAIGSSVHSAPAPFEVRVTRTGPDVLPAGRHFVMPDDPAWFAATLDAFIRPAPPEPRGTGSS
ncbi:MAG: hypothetical protein JF586_21080 [Burkholderiales bacterium]|nr:hypothetical protein [Burkholderiales bacterium]